MARIRVRITYQFHRWENEICYPEIMDLVTEHFRPLDLINGFHLDDDMALVLSTGAKWYIPESQVLCLEFLEA